MSKHAVRFFLISLVFISQNSCNYLNTIRLKADNFGAVIDLTQNLVFKFNTPLADESDLNHWFSADFIDFSPKVEGKFRWKDAKTLVFSPAHSFLAATNYTVKLNNTAKNYADAGKTIDNEPIKFQTPAPKVENITTFWAKSDQFKPSLVAKVNFNYTPKIEELTKYFAVQNNEQSLSFDLLPSQDDHAVLLKLKESMDEKESLSLKLNRGYTIANFTVNEDYQTELQTPTSDFEIEEITADFEENVGFIKVITNTEVKPETLVGNITVVSTEADNTGKLKNVPVKFEMLDNGFIIRGKFDENNIYTVKIKRAFESKLGGKLSKDYSSEVVFGQRPSEIAFNGKKSVYLSANGFKNIAVNIVNTPKVNVQIAKLFEGNILPYLKSGRYANYNYEEYDDEGGPMAQGFNYQPDKEEDYSSIILDRKFDTRGLPKNGGSSILNINNLNQGKNKGVFLVSVTSEQDYWIRDTRLVAISDIGLITKHSQNAVLIFANSIHNANGLPDVEIALISKNNQVVATAKTDANGVAIIDNLGEKLGKNTLAMVTAKLADDFNFMTMEGSEVETSRFEIEGKHDNGTGFDAFIYGDRNMYRPGETMNFVTVLRNDLWKVEKAIPLKARLLMPNGKEYFTAQKNTNEQGAIEFNIPTEASVVTGLYTFEILNGNDILLASKSVNLEEFMPDRIKVDLKTSKETYDYNDAIEITAQVNHMYGAPAIDHKYEMELKLNRIPFKAKKYPGYNFEINKNSMFENELREGKTNATGQAKELLQSAKSLKDMGLIEAKLFFTVFDESARPVNRLKIFNIYTQPIFYGIKATDYYVGTNTPMRFELLALNKNQSPVNTQAMVEVVQNEYQTVLEKADGSYRYVSKKITKSLQKRKVNFENGQASFSFTPTLSGEYDIRVYPEGAAFYTEQSFYAYKYGSTQSTAFEVNNEGQVDISFDKEKYKVGDMVTALFKTPFAGKMLVTVEKNKVYEYHYLDTDKKSAELRFKLTADQLPNIYVSATLFRPMGQNHEMPLTLAHGYSFAEVEEPSLMLPVAITAVEKSRSNTKQKISVKTGAGNAYVSIAVVDEGILQLKNFRTPDIFKHFYQKRALDVKSYDMYPFLFPEIQMSDISYTGGDGYNLEKRVNPLANCRVELVSKWSKLLKTNGAGEASFEFDFPQFAGDLRIMAVAFKDERFGSAEKNMIVADPVIITAGLPRVLSPGDQLTIPVTVKNTTQQAMNVVVSSTLTGGLVAVSPSKTSAFNLGAEKEIRTNFVVNAPKIPGQAEVLVQVTGSGEVFSNKTKITVRQAAGLVKNYTTGEITMEKSETVNLSKDYMEGTDSHMLRLSNSPLVQMTGRFEDLLGYPHGCAEQTISKAFPQIYLADFAREVNLNMVSTNKKSEFNPNHNVQMGINRLEGFLTPEGGLAFWPASSTANPWVTAYAAHFLVEAKKADFEVKKSFLNKLLAYITANNNTSKPDEYVNFYNNQGQLRARAIPKSEIIYGLYVLALADSPQKSLMNYYKQNQSKLTVSQKYMLAAAFKQIGDNSSHASLLPKQFDEEKRAGHTYSDLHSPIRNMALVLNTLLDTDAQNLQIPVIARQLSAVVDKTKYLNTQEESFAFLALGKYAKTLPINQMGAKVSSNGKDLGTHAGKNSIFRNGLFNSVNITTKGKGQLYYFLESEGISKTGKVLEEDKSLKIRRNYFTRDGRPIVNNTFSQNQLVVVKLTLGSANEIPIRNVVITDILPAGLEIENPRISGERGMEWIKNQAVPEHFDIRDDRINLFTQAGKVQEFYYLARAVSKGKFILGPVSADAMYSAEARSYHGAGVVTVN